MLEKARHCVKKLCYTVKFRNILLLEMEPSSAAVFLSISAESSIFGWKRLLRQLLGSRLRLSVLRIDF